ncbi:hypothetical protein ACQZ28_10565, partial [Neisseria meningitidis]
QVLDVVSFALGQLRLAHGNLSCRKGRMLPHTGLFLLGKVALQMRIRHTLKSRFYQPLPKQPSNRQSQEETEKKPEIYNHQSVPTLPMSFKKLIRSLKP